MTLPNIGCPLKIRQASKSSRLWTIIFVLEHNDTLIKAYSYITTMTKTSPQCNHDQLAVPYLKVEEIRTIVQYSIVEYISIYFYQEDNFYFILLGQQYSIVLLRLSTPKSTFSGFYKNHKIKGIFNFWYKFPPVSVIRCN